jgi:hypothetical protein
VVGGLVRENGNNTRPPTEGTFIKASRHRPLARAIPRSVHFWPPQATRTRRPPTRRQATHPPTGLSAGGLGRVACVALAPASGNASEGHALPVAWQG